MPPLTPHKKTNFIQSQQQLCTDKNHNGKKEEKKRNQTDTSFASYVRTRPNDCTVLSAKQIKRIEQK